MKKYKRLIFAGIAAAVLAVSAVMTYASCWNKIFIESDISSIYTQSKEYPMSVFFFDVGSANAILISCDGYNILVDSGLEKVQMSVLDYFDILDVDKLDVLILTHPDKDHIGNMADVVEEISVDRFITCQNGDYDLTQIYLDLIDTLDAMNVDIEYAQSGDSLTFGRLTLDIVSPCKVYDNTNNNSVAFRLTYGEFSAFLSGDIEAEAESDILLSGADISADLLCVAHHGSGSSSTEEFLSAVNPECAIISVEMGDSQPNNGTLNRLISHGCEIYITDECGTVAAVSDGADYKIITQFDTE